VIPFSSINYKRSPVSLPSSLSCLVSQCVKHTLVRNPNRKSSKNAGSNSRSGSVWQRVNGIQSLWKSGTFSWRRGGSPLLIQTGVSEISDGTVHFCGTGPSDSFFSCNHPALFNVEITMDAGRRVMQYSSIFFCAVNPAICSFKNFWSTAAAKREKIHTRIDYKSKFLRTRSFIKNRKFANFEYEIWWMCFQQRHLVSVAKCSSGDDTRRWRRRNDEDQIEVP